MSTTTTYLGMTKPGTTDLVDITVLDADLDTLDAYIKNLERNLGFLTVGHETVLRNLAIQAGVTMTSQLLRGGYFVARRNETVTQVRMATTSTSAGATPTICRFGLYTVAGNGDLTLVASTPNDTTLFAGANTLYTKALSANYGLVRGTQYALAALVVTAAAAPSIPTATTSANVNDMGLAPLAGFTFAGQADLPSSVTSANASATTNVPFLIVSP